MRRKQPLRDYDTLTATERKAVIDHFHTDYLGQGIAERYRLTVEAFRRLRRESREHYTR